MSEIMVVGTKGRFGTGVFMQKQPSKGFFKKSVMRNFAEFTRKHLCGNLFFDKVKLCRSAASMKASL